MLTRPQYKYRRTKYWKKNPRNEFKRKGIVLETSQTEKSQKKH